MASEGLSETRAAEILHRDLGGDWELSNALGTMQVTRLARQGDQAVAIKITDTPSAILRRLSDLGVTPEIVALDQIDGIAYLIQRVVTGPHPDHAWWLAHRVTWAEMINRYLNDDELALLVGNAPGFWRLDVTAARGMIERDVARSDRNSPALRSTEFDAAQELWRQQLIPSWPMRPVHPDPHIHNYVISGNTPYLLDWDHIDLSDPVRDVGWQIWGGLPRSHWAEFLDRVDVRGDEDREAAVCWWSAFKMLGNALFNDSRNDLDGVAFHVGGFVKAARGRGWLE